MKNKRLLIGLMVVVLAFGLSGNVWAATAGTDPVGTGVETMHILAVKASTEALSISAADIGISGGIPVDAVGVLPAYLQYTTITGATGTYEITAQITAGTLPLGTELQLTTTPNILSGSGTGQGTGVSGLAIPLISAVDIVTAIPSCYTGTGTSDGAQVDHVLHILDFANLDFKAAADVTITYTIQDTVV